MGFIFQSETKNKIRERFRICDRFKKSAINIKSGREGEVLLHFQKLYLLSPRGWIRRCNWIWNFLALYKTQCTMVLYEASLDPCAILVPNNWLCVSPLSRIVWTSKKKNIIYKNIWNNYFIFRLVTVQIQAKNKWRFWGLRPRPLPFFRDLEILGKSLFSRFLHMGLPSRNPKKNQYKIQFHFFLLWYCFVGTEKTSVIH